MSLNGAAPGLPQRSAALLEQPEDGVEGCERATEQLLLALVLATEHLLDEFDLALERSNFRGNCCQRDAFTGHLDGVGVPELIGREVSRAPP
jgi:hypothetical protein